MKAIIVQDNQRGLLFRHGKFVRMLEPGGTGCTAGGRRRSCRWKIRCVPSSARWSSCWKTRPSPGLPLRWR